MTPKAILLDVYDTILTVDFAAVLEGLARQSGLTVDEWIDAGSPYIAAAQDGTLTLEEAFSRTLSAAGRPTAGAGDLVSTDLRLLLRHSRVFSDLWPFLRISRERSVPVVLVSNCAQNTRPLLDALNILIEVDAAVLSCEVRAVKPEPAIYQKALDLLEVSPHEALLIDDQAAYCQGALEVGLQARQLTRGASDGPTLTALRWSELV
ncbi:HAD family hydrolase [Ornithinimicrobium panacihumi]|uniref:HAD family hydrolase n=1 Tax=Ornithinimicrobium panacihumi TaxID=2008449 RepID=UPI003F8AB1F0